MARKPLSVEIVEEGDERFVVRTFANGDVVRERVDPDKTPMRRPQMRRWVLKSEAMNKTRRKRF